MEIQHTGTAMYMDLNNGIWYWRDGANSNALRMLWAPSSGFRAYDNHSFQLGDSGDFRMSFDGTDTIFNAVAGDLKIQDNGTTRYTFSTATGAFTATGDITAYSDARLKENVEDLESVEAKISKLRPVRYDRNDIDKHEFGFIAQEVREVFPECVLEHRTGLLSVNYAKLSTIAIKALQEQSERISKLEEMVNALTK